MSSWFMRKYSKEISTALNREAYRVRHQKVMANTLSTIVEAGDGEVFQMNISFEGVPENELDSGAEYGA